MALSMDEQRVLAEIERRLAAEEPSLAVCMTNFRRPGPAAVLRSPRARIIGSLFTVLLVAMISLMVYAMIPFRTHGTRAPAGKPDTLPSQTQISAAGTGGPGTVSARASTGAARASAAKSGTSSTTVANAGAGANVSTSVHSATPGTSAAANGATSQAQGTKAKASGTAASDRLADNR